MAETNVRIRLAADDSATPKINQVKQSLSQLLAQTGAAGTMAGSLMAGGLTAGLTTAVQMAQGAAQAAWDLGVMGAQAERTEASFVTLASSVGQSGQAMLASMRTMTAGTVADTDLMLAANRAMMLGVSDNAEEMGQLMAAAIERGRALGVSSQQAVNDIITGIGRMSPMILDNLGIVGAQQSMEEYARSLGVTADALTDVQKKQALVNAVIASSSGGPVLEDAASAFERMNTAIENMKADLGELFGPAIAAIAEKLAEAVGGINDAVDAGELQATQSSLFQLGNTLNGLMTAYDDAIVSMQNAAKAADSPGLKTAAMNVEMLGASIQGVAEEYNRAAAITGAPLIDVEALRRGIVQFAQLGDEMKNAATDAGNLEISIIAVANAARNMAAQLRGGFAGRAQALALQAVELGAPLEQVETLLVNTVDAINATEIAYDGSTLSLFRNQLAMEENLAGLDGMVDGLTAAQAAAAKFASAGVGTATKALNDLQSSVSGLVSSQISGALSLDGISLPGGPRQDDVNENARRLAAIANEGLIGQDWLGEFAQEAPSTYADLMLKIASGMDAQGAARMLLEQFQSGLRPDLLDFDMIKQRVKDQLTSQQAIADMTADLTSQLMAEMGVSAEEVQGALSQLGLGTGGAADSSNIKQEFLAGLDANGIATGSVAAIATAFKSNESSLRTSGGVVGAWWGEGFMATVGDNVPGQLLEMLTVKLVPFIWAAIRTSQSTTAPEE